MKKILYAIMFFFVAIMLDGDNPFIASITRGTDFLKNQVMQDHYFLDCQTKGGIACPLYKTGKVFVAYFIADALQPTVPSEVKNKLLSVIAQEERNLRWGYSPNAPIDADDTAFAIQALLLLNAENIKQNIQAYLRVLQENFYVDNFAAYSTFANQKESMIAILPNIQNNAGIHAEVNANLANLWNLLGRDKFLDKNIVTLLQAETGAWHSYFYPSKYYATYLFLKAFCTDKELTHSLHKGINFILRSQNQNGSFGQPANVYETALALNGLLACPASESNDAIQKSAHYLLTQQHAFGSWNADDKVIWQYIYADITPVVWMAYDTQHVLTTALAVRALKNMFIEKSLSK